MRRCAAWAGLVAGVALLAVAAVGLWHDDEIIGFGDAGAGSRTTDGSPHEGDRRDPRPPRGPGTTDERTDPSTLPRDEAAVPLLGIQPARLPDPNGQQPGHGTVEIPETLEIASVGIAAPIDAAGVGHDGALEIPDDVRRAGWFRHGARPGAASGSSVIAAHVDSRDGGPGAFYRLPDVQEGDAVTVTDAEGESIDYVVTALIRYAKDELPAADLFRDGDPHRLVLITCGGAFDEGSRTYAENIVVIAAPSS